MAQRQLNVVRGNESVRPAKEATAVSQSSSLRIGLRIKHMRLLLNMTLATLAKASGTSESMLSKIENGVANPSFRRVEAIAAALGMPVGDLFEPQGEADSIVLRNGERPMIGHYRTGPGILLEAIIPAGAGHLLSGFIQHIEPGGHSGAPVGHEGEEFGYVLEGDLELEVSDRIYRMGPGDSFVFRSEIPHAYRNVGQGLAKVLWLNTPPTF